MTPDVSAAPRDPRRALRIAGAAWILVVIALLARCWWNVARVDARRGDAPPSVTPFPIPRETADGSGRGGSAHCQEPRAPLAATVIGRFVAQVDANGLLCVREAVSGDTAWSLDASGNRGPVTPLPVTRSGEAVVFAAPTGVLYALDLAGGAPRWATRLGDRFLGAPHVVGDRIRVDVARGDARLRATVDAETGEMTAAAYH